MSRSDPVTVLALNPGSSSLKAVLRDAGGEVLLRAKVQRLGTDRAELTVDDQPGADPGGSLTDAVGVLAAELDRRGAEVDVVAHRVVHGGPDHHAPEVVDDPLVEVLGGLVPFAPLHLPGDLESIAAARSAWPEAVHVACFDTAFHAGLPDEARRLPLPAEVEALGVRRYGFHGLSLQHVVDTVEGLGRAVLAHLGSGCSVTAVDHGRPVHTSMSFSPTGGTVQATRAGDLDPEVLLFLVEQGWSVAELRTLVDRRSGLTGLSGGSADVRDLLDRRAADPAADLALRVFVRSVAQAVAAAAAALDGWDTLVFTGGVGEHAAEVRDAVTARLAHLGRPRVVVVPTDEEVVLDRQARGTTSRPPVTVPTSSNEET